VADETASTSLACTPLPSEFQVDASVQLLNMRCSERIEPQQFRQRQRTRTQSTDSQNLATVPFTSERIGGTENTQHFEASAERRVESKGRCIVSMSSLPAKFIPEFIDTRTKNDSAHSAQSVSVQHPFFVFEFMLFEERFQLVFE
jgi:hypothetical protein